MRELGEVRVGVAGIEAFQRLANLPVQAHSPGGREVVIEGVTHQDVGEAQPTARPRNLADQSRDLGLLERIEDLVLGEAADSLERIDAELTSDDRGEHEQVPAAIGRGLQPAADRLGHARRDGQRLPMSHVLVAQQASSLDGEERVALASLMDTLDELGWERSPSRQLEQARRLVRPSPPSVYRCTESCRATSGSIAASVASTSVSR